SWLEATGVIPYLSWALQLYAPVFRLPTCPALDYPGRPSRVELSRFRSGKGEEDGAAAGPGRPEAPVAGFAASDPGQPRSAAVAASGDGGDLPHCSARRPGRARRSH